MVQQLEKFPLIDDRFPFEESAINEHVFIVRTNKKLLDPLFGFFFLYSNHGKNQILKDFRGSAQGGISREFINKITIPLPPLQTQKKIAAILEKADRAREKRKEANKLLAPCFFV